VINRLDHSPREEKIEELNHPMAPGDNTKWKSHVVVAAAVVGSTTVSFLRNYNQLNLASETRNISFTHASMAASFRTKPTKDDAQSDAVDKYDHNFVTDPNTTIRRLPRVEHDPHHANVALLPLLEWEQESLDIKRKGTCNPPSGTPSVCCLGSTSFGGNTDAKYRPYCADSLLPKHVNPLIADVKQFFSDTQVGCDVCRIMELAQTNKLNIAFHGDSVHAQAFQGFICELARRDYEVKMEYGAGTPGSYRYAVQNITYLKVHSPLWGDGETVNVTNFKQYRVPAATPGDFAAVFDFADVIVLGFGLHYNLGNLRAMHQNHNANFDRMQQYIVNKTSSARPPKLLIHREMNAQHFSTPDGSYGANSTGNTGGCFPRKSAASSFRDAGFLKSAREAKFLNVYAAPQLKYDKDTNPSSLLVSRAKEDPQLDLWVIPFYNFTAPHFEMHSGRIDCTHICHTPYFWYPIWHGIRKAMDWKFGPL